MTTEAWLVLSVFLLLLLVAVKPVGGFVLAAMESPSTLLRVLASFERRRASG